MSYRDTLVRMGDASAGAVVRLWGALEAGTITEEMFTELTAIRISTWNARATLVADLGLATTLSAQLARPIAPLGIAPPDDLDRLRRAAGTVVALGTLGRAERLGRSEPLETAARAYSEGIRRSPHVSRWRRQTSGDACPICTAWAAEGELPDTVAMGTHKGCTCIPVPVTT